jgi:hypothetical protein
VTLERRKPLRSNPKVLRQWQDRSRKYPGNTIPSASRKAVRARSRDRCEAAWIGCTGKVNALHHRAPRRSRDHSPANLLAVCSFCHRMIHDNPDLAYERGHLVRSRS